MKFFITNKYFFLFSLREYVLTVHFLIPRIIFKSIHKLINIFGSLLISPFKTVYVIFIMFILFLTI